VPTHHVLDRLKLLATDRYLATCAAAVKRALRGQSGERDLRRIVILAPLARNNGLASAARLQWEALRQIGIDAELVDATPALRNPLFRVPHRPGSAYIVHAAAPQSANLLASALPHAATAYRIAYWAWELPDPPVGWAGCERNFAEIWTPSTFAQTSLAKLFRCQIHVVPHVVPAKQRRFRRRGERFTVLAMADTRSSLSRKNPEGALKAFRAAFGTSQSARLILKLNGQNAELDRFERTIPGLIKADNVEIVRSYLDVGELATLYYRADAFLSLHRAEGFGLPMLEAMTYGVPVVATAWSGNMDFMGPSDSELVPYRLEPVSDWSGVYTESVWAEPDVAAAARALRRLADDHDHYDRVAGEAYRRVLATSPRFPITDCGSASTGPLAEVA
jgi:glycosyltransferase involved in cell wall biosynthesis